ncbi:hypothetical protein AVEN_48910-1 [Araneus ventricosus]|uniref:Uncharacterized protein n=1 Tax=Araneus ventricosus TaxID=182803 RepID=A0A4Y2AGT3_ARAVE|nr:hypothetical protein AVEN_48910-1 [Araneus ventricosus]
MEVLAFGDTRCMHRDLRKQLSCFPSHLVVHHRVWEAWKECSTKEGPNSHCVTGHGLHYGKDSIAGYGLHLLISIAVKVELEKEEYSS